MCICLIHTYIYIYIYTFLATPLGQHRPADTDASRGLYGLRSEQTHTHTHTNTQTRTHEHTNTRTHKHRHARLHAQISFSCAGRPSHTQCLRLQLGRLACSCVCLTRPRLRQCTVAFHALSLRPCISRTCCYLI